ncbi:CBASS oligonucleotide cyclase [Roseiconus lacunae]|uniref:CBASS oligonucleotide cyclase n=1 Tax=Roseiconus lacunae TaxID=2605694 RepID=UPI001E4AAF07|nr:CBASS oligonucleotide cyclase [Roseiconus lacunae]MCD0462369.1 nucleotidyltransferase [Roseiconus lacunae]
MGGGGGGGGGGGLGSGGLGPPDDFKKQIEQARKEEQQRLDQDLTDLLRDLLMQFNNRDTELTRDRLDQALKCLSEVIEIDAFLFGGSVAKHTYVDGLSDIDGLVTLKGDGKENGSPQDVLDAMHRQLAVNFSREGVASIEKGNMAVTINYNDGSQVQLLPAIRSGDKVMITDSSGNKWKETNPKEFKQTLTKQNQELNGFLVPAIKLAKSAIASLPPQQRLSGYHVESLAVDAAKSYSGEKNVKDLFVNLLDHASRRVLKPIRDVTGQSRTVDDSLGKADSLERKNCSQALASIARRLSSATTVSQWKVILSDE